MRATKPSSVSGPSEKQFMAMVIQFAKLMGWAVFHPYDSRRSTSGFPDLTMVRGNRVLFVELKAATGRLRAEQVVWATTLAAVGGTVEHHVWRPTTEWELIQEALR